MARNEGIGVGHAAARAPLLWGVGRGAAMLTLAHGHHGAALPPTRWRLPLHRAAASSPARRRKPLHWYKCALRWGTYLHLSTIWAASGAASSPWACLRLPASSFLFLRLPAAAAAHAAAIPHTNWCTVQTGVILEPLVLSEQRTVTYQRR